MLEELLKAHAALQKIQKQLNSLTEAKSTTLKCTFIYKFIEMMKCYIDSFPSFSDFTKIKELVQKFKANILKIIKIEKDDNIYKLKEKINQFYKEKYSLIKEQKKTIKLDKNSINFVYNNVDPKIIKDIQEKEFFFKKGDKNVCDIHKNFFNKKEKEYKEDCSTISKKIMEVTNQINKKFFITFKNLSKGVDLQKSSSISLNEKIDYINSFNKYEPFKWKENKIEDFKIGIENALYQYALIGLDMFNISEFKEEERYTYLVGKLLSYNEGFIGHNISDPDIIELIENSKDQKKIGKLIDCLSRFYTEKKHEFNIRIFSALSSILLNYLDLLKDLLPNNEIDFNQFNALTKIMDSFYIIKDGIQITLIDNFKDHELLKNKDFWKQFFSSIKQSPDFQKNGQNNEDMANTSAIADCLAAMINYGFNDSEIQDVFKYIGININETNETNKIIKEYMKEIKDTIITIQNFKYVIYINWKLFSSKEENCCIPDEEIKKFYNLLENNFKHLDYIFLFLNKNRDRLGKVDTEKKFKILEKIFVICMDYVSKNIDKESENEFKDKEFNRLSKFISILSNTYYLNVGNSKILISAKESFKNHQLLQNLNFWKNEFFSKIFEGNNLAQDRTAEKKKIFSLIILWQLY